MDKEFINKVIIITGSSRGIGKEIAINMAKKGAVVIVNYLKSHKEANDLVKIINKKNIGSAVAFKADITKKKMVLLMYNKILKIYGKIDILINNAGGDFGNDGFDKNNKKWNKNIAVNLTGVYNCMSLISPIMIKQKSGNILNISSLRSFLGAKDIVGYAAAKAGVDNLTKSYAKILAPFVNVNSVALGMMKIGINQFVDEKIIKEKSSKNLMQRIGKKEDVINVVEFFISNKSNFITGQTLIVDGGAILAE